MPLDRPDRFAVQGDAVIHQVSFAREIASLSKLTRGMSDEGAREMLRHALPCVDLEHRWGVCPHGHAHDRRDVEVRNTVMDAFYGILLDGFLGTGTTSQLATYVAAGTAGTASTNADAALGAEFYRAPPTDRQHPAVTTGVVYFFFGTTVANAFLHEFGIFVGAATATPGSGLLAARWLADFNKDNTQTLNGQYSLQRA